MVIIVKPTTKKPTFVDINFTKLSTASYIGPGIWFSLHSLCMAAVDEKNKSIAYAYITFIKERFPCKQCRDHFTEYCLKDPPANSEKLKDGLFGWSVRCHNNANILTKKEEVSYEDVYALYSKFKEGEVCETVCTGETH